MALGQPPALLLVLAVGLLIGEQLLGSATRTGLRLPALVIDQYAQVPAGVLSQLVPAAPLHDVLSDNPLLFLLVQNGDLILLEKRIPVVKIAPIHLVDPLHDIGGLRAGGLRICGPVA